MSDKWCVTCRAMHEHAEEVPPVRLYRDALRDWVIRMGGDYDAMLAQNRKEEKA